MFFLIKNIKNRNKQQKIILNNPLPFGVLFNFYKIITPIFLAMIYSK